MDVPLLTSVDSTDVRDTVGVVGATFCGVKRTVVTSIVQ